MSNELEEMLRELKLSELESVPYDKLIGSYHLTKNHIFLLGLCVKLIAELKSSNVIHNDYAALKRDYVDFKTKAIDTMNVHTKMIEAQTTALEKLSDNYDQVMKFLTASKTGQIN